MVTVQFISIHHTHTHTHILRSYKWLTMKELYDLAKTVESIAKDIDTSSERECLFSIAQALRKLKPRQYPQFDSLVFLLEHAVIGNPYEQDLNNVALEIHRLKKNNEKKDLEFGFESDSSSEPDDDDLPPLECTCCGSVLT